MASALLATGVALLYSKTAPRVYEANSLVEFDPTAVRPLSDKVDSMRASSNYWDTREGYETQFKIITSERVLTKVVRDLNLTTSPSFAKDPQHPPTVETVVERLQKLVIVDSVKGSRLFTISARDSNPAQAQRLANAITQTYVEQNLDKSISQSADAATWLNGQVDHYRTQLETDENQLHEFKAKNELPSSTLEEVSRMIRLEMQAYDEALTHSRTRMQELAARSAELDDAISSRGDSVPASELLSNGYLQSLRAQALAASKDVSELEAAGKGANHPLVKAAHERREQARTAMVEEITNIRSAVERDLAVVRREEAGEAALYEGARRHAVDLNMKELEYHRLDRTRDQDEKLYGVLLERMKEADLARMMNVNNVRVVDYAKEPKIPVSPKTPVNTGIGLAIGLLVGISLALFREQLDSTIKTAEQVEHRLGVTFLGLLPALEDAATSGGKAKKNGSRRGGGPLDGSKPELIVHDRPLSGIAEAARTIRTNLMFMNPDRPHRKLLVTSAAPSEGKTTVACSIAISLAQSGQRVCIVDCDLRRPRMHRIFGRQGDVGLTNVLVGDATVDEVARPTEVENLWCVPSGPIPPNPADTLHSERFRRFVEELASKFDRVVIDSPPLAAVTDSAIVSTLVDEVVFVVRAFRTTRVLSQQGLRALVDVGAPIAGAVLNAVDLRRHDYNYYQYYYYRREGYAPVPVTQVDGNDSASAN